MLKNTFFLLFLISLFSCVPNKDLVYLQGSPDDLAEIKRLNRVPYRLQVDDIITIDLKSSNEELISFFRKTNVPNGNSNNINVEQSFTANPSYLSGYSIDVHGNIRLPYLGEVNVLGYTTTEVREKLEKELSNFYNKEEEIFITVKLSGIKYTIIGEIAQPGTKVIMQNNVNIIEAIANSGGLTQFGKRTDVEVIRVSATDKEKFTIDLTKMEAYNSPIFNIKPNDLIQIKPIKQKSLGLGTTGLESLSTIISVFSLLTSVIIISRNL